MCKKLVFLVVLMVSQACNAVEVARWDFEETSGTTATDLSGLYVATLAGSDTLDVDGRFGSGIDFAGDGGATVDAASSEAFRFTGDFSIALWINSDTAFGDYTRFVDISAADGGLADSYRLFTGSGANADNFRFMSRQDGSNTNNIHTRDMAVGTWSLLVLRHDLDGDVTMNVLQDGDSVDAAFVAANSESWPTAGSIVYAAGELKLGRMNGGGRKFDGQMDGIAFYDEVLTDAQVAAMFYTPGSSEYPHASGPEPAAGAMLEATTAILRWRAGDFAISHDVYIGESLEAVSAATRDDADLFAGRLADTMLPVGMVGGSYPEGLVPGTVYYWRVDEVNEAEPNSPWKGDVWSFRVRPLNAWSPTPPDGTQFVDPNQDLTWEAGIGTLFHTVYFGRTFEEVDSAVAGGWMQVDSVYDAGTLELDATYYWRIDEFKGITTDKGEVWSFTTLPEVAVSDPDLVLWYKFDEGVDTTAVDWSGHNHHATLVDGEWVPRGWFGDAALKLNGYGAIRKLMYDVNDITEVSACAWIQTDAPTDQYVVSFDRNEYYRLEINGNGAGPGQVGWDVMTEMGQLDYGSVTRVDDGQWHHVCGVWDNGTATIYIDGEPEPSATLGTVVGTTNVRYGFVGANSEATAFDGSRGTGVPIAGAMDDLRVYHRALTQAEIQAIMRPDLLLAYGPSPGSGATLDVTQISVLSWLPGDGATQHDVYFGADRDMLIAADATDATGIYQGRQNATSFMPPALEWGKEYFWRVDEVAADDTTTDGTIWSVTITDYLLVDDFESYTNSSPNRVFQHWIDGLGFSPDPNFPDGHPGNGTGAIVGYDPLVGDIMELTVVNSVGQSMPIDYNNVFAPGFSEAERTFSPAQNWTREGVTTLVIHFAGRQDNTGQLYAKINGTRVDYAGDPADIASGTFTAWEIDVASLGVNLTSVTSLTIGIEGGAAGLLFVDDIRLIR